MSKSQLDVYKKAAGRIGQTAPVALDATDRVTAQCNLFYDETRRGILRRHALNFAKDVRALAPYYVLSSLSDAPLLSPIADVNGYSAWGSGTHQLSNDGVAWTYTDGASSVDVPVDTSTYVPPKDGWPNGMTLSFPSDNEEWPAVYRIPPDYIRIREILPSGTVGLVPVYTADGLMHRPVAINGDSKTLFDVQGDKLYTVIGDAKVNYTFDQEDLALWDDSAYEYLWTQLAYDICMPITGKMALHRQIAEQLAVVRRQAPATNANEKHRKLNRNSTLVNSRLQ